LPARIAPAKPAATQIASTTALAKRKLSMKVVATPVAKLLVQLHDNATDLASLIEAIPVLTGDDIPKLIDRVQTIEKLKELEAEFPVDKIPSDAYLQTRVGLLKECHNLAADLGLYEFRAMSNKHLRDRAELLRNIRTNDIGELTDQQLGSAVNELQCERRRRKHRIKVLPSISSEQEAIEDPPKATGPSCIGELRIVT
jgi:hypothetical protein